MQARSVKMLFNTFAFAIFLPLVFILYWGLPHKYRWTLILVSSYYFYMSWNAKYVVLILFTSVVSYTSARLIEMEESKRKKNLNIKKKLKRKKLKSVLLMKKVDIIIETIKRKDLCI